jgi:hypothetical protein
MYKIIFVQFYIFFEEFINLQMKVNFKKFSENYLAASENPKMYVCTSFKYSNFKNFTGVTKFFFFWILLLLLFFSGLGFPP